MEKTCNRCLQSKIIEEYNRDKSKADGFANRCKECNKEVNRLWYACNKDRKIQKSMLNNKSHRDLLRNRLAEIKEKGYCIYCGEGTTVCLDFHHRDNKDFEISTALSQGFSWHRIQEELSKCDMVCANCHRKLHAGLI